MKAHLEPIIYVLRVGKDFKEFGDPYELSGTVLILEGEAYIQGVSGVGTKATLSAIKNALKEIGINKVHWTRLKREKKKVDIDV